MRQAERRALRNRAARSSVRTYVKNAADAVASSATDAAAVVRAAVRALDKAAQKGIVHPNAAARRKSRLMSRLHRLSVAPGGRPGAATTTRHAPLDRHPLTHHGHHAPHDVHGHRRHPRAPRDLDVAENGPIRTALLTGVLLDSP